ncbi:hypothetical protein MAR_005211, partial [Mya arenaria]
FRQGTANPAVQALEQIYTCSLGSPPFSNIFRENINAKLSGFKWNTYRACRKSSHSESQCLKEMSTNECTNSSFITT